MLQTAILQPLLAALLVRRQWLYVAAFRRDVRAVHHERDALALLLHLS